MRPNVIEVDFGRIGKVHCSENDLWFPQLYRVTAFRWEITADGSKLLTTDQPAPPCYTLEYSLTWRPHANPTFAPIDAPDPHIDKGWVIVRHHPTEAEAEGYVEAMHDYEYAIDEAYDMIEYPLYRFREEYFTVLHRPSIDGKPTPLIVYCTEVPHELIGWDYWGRAIAAGGQEVSADGLYSWEEDISR